MAKHLQAYFREKDDAESAAASLVALGATQVQTDRSAVAAGPTADDATDVVAMVPQLHNTMLGAPYPFQPTAVLFGGFGPGGETRTENVDADVTGAGVPMLTAVVEDALYEQAVGIVKRNGGTVD